MTSFGSGRSTTNGSGGTASSAHNLVHCELRRTGDAAALGCDRDLPGHCTAGHIRGDLGIFDHSEGGGLPGKGHLRGLLQPCARDSDQRSHWPARRTKARNSWQDFEGLRAGQRGRAGRHGHVSRERPCGNHGGDECRAREYDSRCFRTAELHHRRTAEALAENANLRAFLAGGRICLHKRAQPNGQIKDRAAAIGGTARKIASIRCRSVEGSVGGLDQLCKSTRAVNVVEAVRHGQRARGS